MVDLKSKHIGASYTTLTLFSVWMNPRYPWAFCKWWFTFSRGPACLWPRLHICKEDQSIFDLYLKKCRGIFQLWYNEIVFYTQVTVCTYIIYFLPKLLKVKLHLNKSINMKYVFIFLLCLKCFHFNPRHIFPRFALYFNFTEQSLYNWSMPFVELDTSWYCVVS